jgi:hypothetical protein
MGKSINVDFDQDEFEKAVKAKGGLTWKEVILRNLPKSDEDVLKDETERFFKRISGWALMNKNSDLNLRFNVMKSFVISALDHKGVSDEMKHVIAIEGSSSPGTKLGRLGKPTRSTKFAGKAKKEKAPPPKEKKGKPMKR